MSFRSGRKLAGAVPRLLWVSKFAATPNPAGRNPPCGVVSTYLGCKREFYAWLFTFANNIALHRVFSSLMLYASIICCVLLSATVLLLRRFSSSPPSLEVTYEQLKVLLVGQKSTVIDVREPWELREYGLIPGSINVPCECSFIYTLMCVCGM